jgi:hypothetical protein
LPKPIPEVEKESKSKVKKSPKCPTQMTISPSLSYLLLLHQLCSCPIGWVANSHSNKWRNLAHLAKGH